MAEDNETPAPAMRPGIKTSEFWLAFAVTVAGALATVYSTHPWAQALGLIAGGLSSAGYSYSRAMAKV